MKRIWLCLLVFWAAVGFIGVGLGADKGEPNAVGPKGSTPTENLSKTIADQKATIDQLQKQIKELQIRAQYDAKVMAFYQSEAVTCQAQPPAKEEKK